MHVYISALQCSVSYSTSKIPGKPGLLFFPFKKNPKNFLPVTKKEGNKKAGYQVSILCLDFLFSKDLKPQSTSRTPRAANYS